MQEQAKLILGLWWQADLKETTNGYKRSGYVKRQLDADMIALTRDEYHMQGWAHNWRVIQS